MSPPTPTPLSGDEAPSSRREAEGGGELATADRPPIEAVVIGASFGAVEALGALLPRLPRDFALPVVVVVHLPADPPSLLATLFAARCALPVKEAEDKEPLHGGVIYFAPPNYHLLVEPDRHLALSSDEPVHYSRPAVDVLFESAADAFGPHLAAVVLTGANADGAAGLRAVHAAGGLALVQRPDSAEAEAMPRAALKACPAAAPLDLAQIARALTRLARRFPTHVHDQPAH